LRNWKDKILGEKINFEVKIVEKIDEMQLYEKVIQIIEGDKSKYQGEQFKFEEAVQALKESSYDV